jgi:hypothetical protein
MFSKPSDWLDRLWMLFATIAMASVILASQALFAQ